MGERCVRIAEVEGSNPLLSTKRETNVKARLSPFIRAIPLSAMNRQAEYGGVPVSTGTWRQDKRAAAPDRLKTGNL